MKHRGWHLIDLKGEERRIAEEILSDVFATAPGTEEGRKAHERFRAFDAMIRRKYGFDG